MPGTQLLSKLIAVTVFEFEIEMQLNLKFEFEFADVAAERNGHNSYLIVETNMVSGDQQHG